MQRVVFLKINNIEIFAKLIDKRIQFLFNKSFK